MANSMTPDALQPIVHYVRRMRLADGGVVRAVADLADAVARTGRPVSIITTDSDEEARIWPDISPNLRLVRSPEPVRMIGALPRPVAEEAARASILHLHTPWDRGNPALSRFARRAGIPCVLSTHGMLDEWSMSQRAAKKRLYLSVFGRRVLEGVAAVHCTAEAEWTQARRWVPRARGVVVPLVFDLADYRDLPGPALAQGHWPEIDTGQPVVLFLSRLHYKKGPEVLVDAVGLLRERGVGARCVFAGPGEADAVAALRRRAAGLGVDGQMLYTGMVAGAEKVSLYQAADVFVLPTSQENFGFVFFEALAAGTPVVTTRGVDTWPELESSGGAVLVERDPAAIADAIEGLLNDDARRAKMGAAGRVWTLDRFAPGKVVNEYLSLYDRLAQGAAPSPDG